MTETTSLISLNHPFGVQRGSIGKALPGREMKIDESGEILVRGDNIASAYWQDGEMKPVTGEDGWLRTGDLGAVDAEGNLYFKGRKKNVIVTPEGMNVYPQDLENALRAQPEVKDCVVLPLPRGCNAVPGAVLFLREGSNPDAIPIVSKANRSLAEYQDIRQWFVWPEEDFPRTATQKPKRRRSFRSRWIDSAEPRIETPLTRALLPKSSRRSRSVRWKNCPDSVHWSGLN